VVGGQGGFLHHRPDGGGFAVAARSSEHTCGVS
jgi:hypothetical protein